MVRGFLLTSLSLIIISCGVCEKVPCVDEVTVVLEGQLLPTFTLELTTGDILKIANCPHTQSEVVTGGFCAGNRVLFYGPFKEELKLKLTQNKQNITQVFRPTYTRFQPQGESCGTCKQATISFRF